MMRKYLPYVGVIIILMYIYSSFYSLRFYRVTLNVTSEEYEGLKVLLVEKGDSPDLPYPSKEGYSFYSWFTKDNCKVTRMTRVTSDLELYPKWGKVSEVEKTPGVLDAFFMLGNEKEIMYRVQTDKGYRGLIEALVSINIDTGKVTGMEIRKQRETAGIGSRIVGYDFGMIGKEITDYQLYFTPLSGATRSSYAVRDIFAKALAQYSQDYLNQ